MTKRDIRIMGIDSGLGGEFGHIDIMGSAKFVDNVQAEETMIKGIAKFEKNLETANLFVAGSMNCKGDIKCGIIKINGVMKSYQGVVYADQITVNGSLTNDGEISADHIKINGAVKGNQMLGDEIEIGQEFSTKLIIRITPANKFENIECTTLKASILECNTISANKIILTKYCVVDTVVCDGILIIDSTCTVRNIEGDCQIERI